MNDVTQLDSIADLDQLLADAGDRPVLLYKHSMTCGTSAMALEELRGLIDNRPIDAAIGMVMVQIARPVSNEIATRFSVRHESPQAILIRNGEVMWRASHFRVTGDAIASAIADLGTRSAKSR